MPQHHHAHRSEPQGFRRAAISAALTVLCAAGNATAQESNVQLFGVVATSVVHLSNQANGAGSRMMAGPWFGPGWGVRGSEDLGNGWSASFRFEGNWDGTTGLAGRTVAGENKFFDKAAWLSLGNRTVSLTAGRQLNAGIDRLVETLDIFNANGDGRLLLSILALNATNSFGGFDTRVDNALKARVNLPQGWRVGASYGMGIPGRVGSNHALDVAQQGENHAIGAYAMGYKKDNSPLEQNVWGLGGNYKMGPARLYAQYMNAKHDKATGLTQTDHVYGLGLGYQVNPAVMVRAAYYRDSAKGVAGQAGVKGTRSTMALLADYNLSKRTSLNVGVFRNSLGGAFQNPAVDPTSLVTLGLFNPATKTLSGTSSTGMSVGITHRF